MEKTEGYISQKVWTGLAVVLLLCAAILIFRPASGFEFVHTDSWVVLENKDIRAVDGPGLNKIFFEIKYENYIPLRMLAYAVIHHFKGYDPAAFHVLNIIFHALTCLLVFALINRLCSVSGINRQQALLAAISGVMVFMLHPVQVETVAWVSALKEAMSGFFSFAALLAFLVFRTGEKQKTGWYYLSLLMFICAMLSKATAIVLPLVMILFDILYPSYERRKPFSHVLQEHGVLLIMAFTMGFLNYLMASATGAIHPLEESSVYSHIATSARLVPFYLSKIFDPSGLTVMYIIEGSKSLADPRAVFALVLIIALIGVLVSARKKLPLVSFAGGLLLITILPVLQIIPFQNWAADRYLYVGVAGPAIVAGLIVARGVKRGGIVKVATVLVFAALLLVMGNQTTHRLRDWQNMVTLWESNLEVNPDSAYSHVFLGQAYLEADENEKALQQFEEGRAIDPELAKVYSGLASYYLKIGENERAYASIKEAFKRNITSVEIHYLLAKIYYETGAYESSARIFALIEENNPEYKDAADYMELSLSFLRVTMAPEDFNKFLESLPLTASK